MFYTTTLGVDPTYKCNAFYQKVINKVNTYFPSLQVVFFFLTTITQQVENNTNLNHFSLQDEERVTERFQEASDVGVRLRRASVTMSQLIEHMSKGPAIVLTNAKLLTCEACKFNKVSFELRKCFPWSKGYQGHYVVLCGYDLVNRWVYYRNPSFADSKCWCVLFQIRC